MARQTTSDLFGGEGDVRSLCRQKDWSATPLGPVESWNPTLRSTVRTALASPFPINLWCGEELTLIYNDAYRDVLGIKHPEALGRPGPEVWSEIWPQVASMFEQIRAGGPPVYAEDEPFFIERADDGAASTGPEEPNAWFTFSLSPVQDEDGSIVAFLNIVSETTDRIRAERQREEARMRAERAEARLLQVFERAPAFLAVLRGPGPVFEYANQAYLDLVGNRDLIDREVFEALPEARGQGFEEILARVFEKGEPFVGRELPVQLARSPDGRIETRYLDFIYYPLEDPDGSVSRVVAHGYDVTGHVQAREAAEQARAEAQEANAAKSRFLRTMSHELRTPINAVLGYSQLLREEVLGDLSEAQLAQLERVDTSTKHLLMLVEDVLDMARVETGAIEVERKSASMAETVDDALSLVRPLAQAQDLNLVSTAGDGPLHYLGDEDRVRQILVNLLTNAVEFTPAGGEVRVTFGSGRPPEGSPEAGREAPGRGPAPGSGSTGNGGEAVKPGVAVNPRQGADPGPAENPGRAANPGPALDPTPPLDPDPPSTTFVRVSDTGVGIAGEHLEKIFEPFAQVEPGFNRSRKGAGLGLAISRQLAELMGGTISVESTPGEGSTFTLWLPEG